MAAIINQENEALLVKEQYDLLTAQLVSLGNTEEDLVYFKELENERWENCKVNLEMTIFYIGQKNNMIYYKKNEKDTTLTPLSNQPIPTIYLIPEQLFPREEKINDWGETYGHWLEQNYNTGLNRLYTFSKDENSSWISPYNKKWNEKVERSLELQEQFIRKDLEILGDLLDLKLKFLNYTRLEKCLNKLKKILRSYTTQIILNETELNLLASIRNNTYECAATLEEENLQQDLDEVNQRKENILLYFKSQKPAKKTWGEFMFSMNPLKSKAAPMPAQMPAAAPFNMPVARPIPVLQSIALAEPIPIAQQMPLAQQMPIQMPIQMPLAQPMQMQMPAPAPRRLARTVSFKTFENERRLQGRVLPNKVKEVEYYALQNNLEPQMQFLKERIKDIDYKTAISEYLGNGYDTMNNLLNGKIREIGGQYQRDDGILYDAEDIKRYKKLLHYLKKLFQEVPRTTNEIISYRCWRHGLKNYVNGQPYNYNQFLSTSLFKDFSGEWCRRGSANKIVMRISIPPGTALLPLIDYKMFLPQGHFDTEYELLLSNYGQLMSNNEILPPERDIPVSIYSWQYLPPTEDFLLLKKEEDDTEYARITELEGGKKRRKIKKTTRKRKSSRKNIMKRKITRKSRKSRK